jgi:outer membrane protein OmpA-like peptidoglycan-associated protein
MMLQRFLIYFFFITQVLSEASAQTDAYTVTRSAFSSDKYDEFSPVFYNNGIVFCSNRETGSLADYSGSLGKAPFSIYFIDTTGKVTWKRSRIFSKELKTNFNDGPVSFSRSGDVVYFSRNLRVEGNLKELTGPGNKLGIFYATFNGKTWDNIREFRFNSEWYNISTPFLSLDGSRLYFASDKPGGYGGSDIYYSEWKNGFWNDPVNLGSGINTAGNESYPYFSTAGEFFFSSDGHPGAKGKDIFVTRQNGSEWFQPLRLDEPLNSEHDDFGLVMHPGLVEGYFSSDRGSTIDIFHFRQNQFQFRFSEPQKENQNCFVVSDTGIISVDSLRLKYVWDFRDGVRKSGQSAGHCYPGPGNYTIHLDLIDSKTEAHFFRKLIYNIEITEIEQPYITSPDVVVIGEQVEFSGLRSHCPGYEIKGFFWDFGDSSKAEGDRTIHTFKATGDFKVRLGLLLKSLSTGEMTSKIVSKTIIVLDNGDKRDSILLSRRTQGFKDISKVGNIKVKGLAVADENRIVPSVFQVVVKSSSSRIETGDSFFKNVPSKYTVREVYDRDTETYIYVIDQHMSLMSTYNGFSEMLSVGYGDTHIRQNILKDAAEKDLHNIMKVYGILTDIYFDSSNRLTTSSNLMLDQIALLMSKYPEISLEIGIHTDNSGIATTNQSVSQFRAHLMVNYLISKGISGRRLEPKGYGGTRPVALSNSTADRRLNSRIDFLIVY